MTRTPRSGVQTSITSFVLASSRWTTEASVTSRRNRWLGPLAPASPLRRLTSSSSMTSWAVPAIFASDQPAASGSTVALWMAKRGSRCRSRALTACHIEPMNSSPSWNWVSVPEMRGEPSLRIVAIVLCLWASKRVWTRSASAGAAAANSDQEAMTSDGAGWIVRRPLRRRKRSSCRRGRPPARVDRRRALLARRARERLGAGGARALLARPPGPRAGGGDGGDADRTAAAAAARAGGVAAADGRRFGVGGGRGRRVRLIHGVLARLCAVLRRAALRLSGAGGARGAERHPLPPAG